jgi:CheY-like chemotaxis protein
VHEGLSGTDLVEQVRRLDKASGNPPRLIYVISANDSPDDLLFYSASGADSHIPKTVSSDSLRSRVFRNATRLRLARFNDLAAAAAAAAAEKNGTLNTTTLPT